MVHKNMLGLYYGLLNAERRMHPVTTFPTQLYVGNYHTNSSSASRAAAL